MWHVALMVFAMTGWQFFSDGPLANYIISALLVAYLCARAAWRSPMWPAYGYGVAMALMTAGCGGMYATQADGYSFLCDKGTGLPISLISGLGAIALVVWVLIREKKS